MEYDGTFNLKSNSSSNSVHVLNPLAMMLHGGADSSEFTDYFCSTSRPESPVFRKSLAQKTFNVAVECKGDNTEKSHTNQPSKVQDAPQPNASSTSEKNLHQPPPQRTFPDEVRETDHAVEDEEENGNDGLDEVIQYHSSAETRATNVIEDDQINESSSYDSSSWKSKKWKFLPFVKQKNNQKDQISRVQTDSNVTSNSKHVDDPTTSIENIHSDFSLGMQSPCTSSTPSSNKISVHPSKTLFANRFTLLFRPHGLQSFRHPLNWLQSNINIQTANHICKPSNGSTTAAS